MRRYPSVHRARLVALVALLVMGTGCGGAGSGAGGAAEAGPPPPPPTFLRRLVLTGPEGARVAIAEFGDDQAYFELTGIRSPTAGFVFQGEVRVEGDRTTYRTTWDGRPFVPIHRRTSGDEVRYQLYAYGLPEPVTLTYDEAASAALDGDALHDKHVRQSRDGSLEAVQRFDREAAIAAAEADLAEAAGDLAEECGAAPEVVVAWDSIDDVLFTERRISVSAYCGTVLDALEGLCGLPPGRAFVGQRVQRVVCRWDQEWSVDLADDGTLRYATADESNQAQKAREALLKETAVVGGMTLAQAMAYARTDVCRSPDGSHLLVVHPHTGESKMGISYGTEERLYHSPQNRFLSRGWFFEPREFAPGYNENFRGIDMRVHSHVEVDREAERCALTCGDRESDWSLVAPEDALPILRQAESVPAPFDREPYALARDRRGIYYYVDRGTREETRRDFHVYRGPRGNLTRLGMRDVASDSEGEVFSTESGDLRLVVDTERAQWIRRTRAQELRRIPVAQNYRLIFVELGVYLGQRFELPCEDY